MTWRMGSIGAAVLCGVLGACAQAEDAGAKGGQGAGMFLPDGAPTAPHEGGYDAVDLVLNEEQRIGAVDGDSALTFGRIAALVPAADGGVWVLDSHGPIIRIYDAAGRHVRDVGREGQGPGEYRSVLGMKPAGDGRVAIWDAGNRRITIFDRQGAYVRSMLVAGGVFAADAFQVDTAGFFYIRSHRPEAGDASAHAWLRISPAGDVVGWIAVPSEDMHEDAPVVFTSEGPTYPFTTATRFALSPLGHVVSGRNDRYAFDIARGADTISVVRLYESIPVQRGERADWERIFERFRERGRSLDYTIPTTKPAYRDLEVDEDGRIWVDRYMTAHEDSTVAEVSPAGAPQRRWREPRTFDVFRADGSFMGTVVVPPRTRLLARSGPLLWGVQTDELGVPYVVRFRLTAASGR
jgi:hypothetical protein